MDSFIITFGQNHVHRIDGKTFDRDCVCQIDAIDYWQARKIAFRVFDGKFCFIYGKDHWLKNKHPEYYPRGIIVLKTQQQKGEKAV